MIRLSRLSFASPNTIAMATPKRAVITGLGIISPLGIGLAAFWESCTAGRSGVRRIAAFDPSDLTSQIAGQVDGFEPLAYMGAKLASRTERYVQFALAAGKEAATASGIHGAVRPDRLGIILGTGSGGLSVSDKYVLLAAERGWAKTDPLVLLKLLPDMAASNLAIEIGAKGPVMTLVAACVSSTQAIGEALRIIRSNAADVVLAGGTEASVTPFGMGTFCLLRALSTNNCEPERASRPFDAARDGFVLAEGAAILVVEELEHARRRDARIIAELVGYAQTSDAYHLVTPSREGEGASHCIELALRDAHLKPDNIDYINAHGTSTLLNDVAETKAIRSVFGKRAYSIPTSSIKSMMGHALGAAGAIETIAAVMTLQTEILPPTINLDSPDPQCDLDYVPNEARRQPTRVIVKNSFGFGGQNACLVLRRFET